MPSLRSGRPQEGCAFFSCNLSVLVCYFACFVNLLFVYVYAYAIIIFVDCLYNSLSSIASQQSFFWLGRVLNKPQVLFNKYGFCFRGFSSKAGNIKMISSNQVKSVNTDLGGSYVNKGTAVLDRLLFAYFLIVILVLILFLLALEFA